VDNMIRTSSNFESQQAIIAVIRLYVSSCRADFSDPASGGETVGQCVRALEAVFENSESIILTDQHFEELILPMTLLLSDTLNPVERLTSTLVFTALGHPLCPPHILSQVCRTNARRNSFPVQSYLYVATNNPNCPEEDRVYVALTE
jgi:hypothetical protein